MIFLFVNDSCSNFIFVKFLNSAGCLLFILFAILKYNMHIIAVIVKFTISLIQAKSALISIGIFSL